MPHTSPLPNEDIIKFLKDNVDPLPNSAYGMGYRASVYLVDGTYLPCVIFRNPNRVVDLAIRRFEEEKKGKSVFSKSSGLGYTEIVKSFVTKGSCIDYYNVARVELSPYAFPQSVLEQIKGETTMGWTGFVVRMANGEHFGFGTSFHFEFFDLPDGYDLGDIQGIINHSYIGPDNSIKTYRGSDTSDYTRATIFREKTYFECYIDEL